ncbi:MAG: H-NS histone family protein [Pseudomonadota bacterium]
MAKLDKMSRDQLEKAKAEAEAQLKEIQKAQVSYDSRRLKELRAEVEAMLAKEGYTLADVLGGKAPKASKSKAPAKYKNPDDATQTWSGRGRQPEWFKAAIAGGKTADDMAI